MRKALLLIIFSFVTGYLAFPQVSYDEPQTYEVVDISVEGATYSEEYAVILYSGLRIGDKIKVPGPEVAEAVKKLWKQKIFDDIQIEASKVVGDKIYLTIQVSERPRISKFQFAGVTNSQASDLREKINFIRGTIWTSEKETRAARIIRNFFVEKGFFNTNTTFVVVDDEFMENGVIIKVNVNKGKRIKINKIRIEGNQEFSDAKLKRKMKEIKEKRFWRVWARSKYTANDFKKSKDNLVNFYNANGFRDARVVWDTVYQSSERDVDVELEVIEGNQYYFRDISWSGNYKYSDDTLGLVLGIEKGDVYNSELLTQRLQGDPTGRDIGSLYLDDGYLFFNIEPVEVLVENDSIDLEIRMNEGPQATIRKISVEGNTKTSDYVILREIRTLPGQKFSRSDMIRSHREISNLGYFNQETLDIVPLPNPQDGTVDIKYVVEEKSSDQFQVQGGWGGRIRDPNTGEVIGGGFVGTVSLAFNNFSTKRFFKKNAWKPIPSGDGQKLSLSIQMNGVGWQNYSISFLEPWLGGKKPNSLGASVYYTVNRNRNTNFGMNIFGSSLDYGIRMKVPDDFFRSFTSLGYKHYTLQNASSFFGDVNFDDGNINILTLKQSFDRTSIDAPLFPRSGSQLTVSVEATPPYSAFRSGVDYSTLGDGEKFKFLEYHKWEFSFTWYKTIFKNLVIKPKIQFGYLGNYNKDYGISPFERFNLGGSGFGSFNFFGQDFVALRGYPENSIGPRINNNDVNSPTLGGNIFNKYSLEFRYPITLNQAAPVWVVGFLEAGNSWLGFKNYNPIDLKRSAGVGIRVVVPMVGLLGVDWGHPFDKLAPNDQIVPGRFNFVFGQEF